MNKAILMGRLTSDPELKQTGSGTDVARFTLAINRRFQKDETDFINCVAWRKTAEFICKCFSKGNMILIVGSIQTRSWEDGNGKKVYATEVIADEAYFTGEKREAQTPSSEAFINENEMQNFTEVDDGGELPF